MNNWKLFKSWIGAATVWEQLSSSDWPDWFTGETCKIQFVVASPIPIIRSFVILPNAYQENASRRSCLLVALTTCWNRMPLILTYCTHRNKGRDPFLSWTYPCFEIQGMLAPKFCSSTPTTFRYIVCTVYHLLLVCIYAGLLSLKLYYIFIFIHHYCRSMPLSLS